MRKPSYFLAAVVAAALVGSLALAQQRQLPGTGKVNALMLLTRKPVQEDLKLTADQIQKVVEAAKKKNVERAGFQGLEREERDKKQAELNKESEQIAAGILTPEQAKRLKQISLQQQGPSGAFADEEVAKELKLTDEQKRKLKELTEETMKEVRKAITPGGDREEARKKIAEFANKLNDKVLDLLTAEQKAKWKELTGTPIKGDLRGDPASAPRRPNDK
jgi:Spy/CpxP family protein refolding chaperone